MDDSIMSENKEILKPHGSFWWRCEECGTIYFMEKKPRLDMAMTPHEMKS
jgi:uncharacterized Zn finger protein